MISIQILTITKNNFKSNSKRDYFKEIINTGSTTLLIASISFKILIASSIFPFVESKAFWQSRKPACVIFLNSLTVNKEYGRVNIETKMWYDCKWVNSPQETKWHKH